MLVTMKEVLGYAEEHEIAIPAVNTPYLEAAQAAIEAAEELNIPIILQHAETHEQFIPIEIMGPILVKMAQDSSVPICVHLDHGSSFEEVMKALRLGFTSVMIDASALSFEENVETTRMVVKIAHAMGATVEAELGHILKLDKSSTEEGIEGEFDPDDVYTNPDDAKEFVERTGVDTLAVAFGTAHGIYAVKPKLDLDRVTAIREKINIPLVMHGGSGLTKEEFQGAIKNGVRKINYYTYMALAGAEVVKELVNAKIDEPLQFHEIALAGKIGMRQNLIDTFRIFSGKKDPFED